ncbi:hypothetical protein COOONC_27020 [Cooperia oncophora]
MKTVLSPSVCPFRFGHTNRPLKLLSTFPPGAMASPHPTLICVKLGPLASGSEPLHGLTPYVNSSIRFTMMLLHLTSSTPCMALLSRIQWLTVGPASPLQASARIQDRRSSDGDRPTATTVALLHLASSCGHLNGAATLTGDEASHIPEFAFAAPTTHLPRAHHIYISEIHQLQAHVRLLNRVRFGTQSMYCLRREFRARPSPLPYTPVRPRPRSAVRSSWRCSEKSAFLAITVFYRERSHLLEHFAKRIQPSGAWKDIQYRLVVLRHPTSIGVECRRRNNDRIAARSTRKLVSFFLSLDVHFGDYFILFSFFIYPFSSPKADLFGMEGGVRVP